MTELRSLLEREFEALADLPVADQAVLDRSLRRVALARGSAVFQVGEACDTFMFVLSGYVRVNLLDIEGREIVLYRIAPGETCILTTAALLSASAHSAYAVTEVDTVAAVLDRAAFNALSADSDVFRAVVFASFGERLATLLRLVADVTFTRVPVRLARCLLERMDAGGCVRATHEVLAVEIGTAREVVSRNLKAFENDGLIALGHGTVRIIKPTGLQIVTNL